MSLNLDLVFSEFNLRMDKPSEQKIYEFEDFRLDAGHLMLYHLKEELPLAPKAVETLLALVERRGEIVSKDELLEIVWPDAIVEESNLFLYLSTLRKTLGTRPDGKPYIETLRRRGYRFSAKVRILPLAGDANHGPRSEEVGTSPITEYLIPDLTQAGYKDNMPGKIGLLQRPILVGAAVVTLTAVLVSSFVFFLTSRPIESIAVMPFTNESGNPDLDYLSNGMTEELISRLSKLPNLQVKASSSVFRYRSGNQTKKIGQELNAQTVLYGWVTQRGDDLQLRVELVDAGSENRIWAETYNKKMYDLVSLQGDIARDLVPRLSLKLTGDDYQKLASNPTENVEAYQLFLKGRTEIRKLTRQEIEKGIALLRQAIDIDPSYAIAYAGISNAYVSLSLAGERYPGDVLPNAKEAAVKAVEIDDLLSEAHSALGIAIFWHDWNWPEAEKHLVRALELDPNNATAHFYYGEFLMRIGRQEEGTAEKKRATEIEPLDPYIIILSARAATDADQDDTMDRVKTALEINPHFFFAHLTAAGFYKRQKMIAESVASYKLAKSFAPDQTWSDGSYASMLFEIGQKEEARAILNDMLLRAESRWVPPVNIALVYHAFGENEQALAWLEKGYQHRDPKMLMVRHQLRFKNLQQDPRFQDLMRRVGFDPDPRK